MKKALRFLLTILIIAVICVFCYSCDDADDKQSISVDIDILKIGKADCIVVNTGTRILMIDTGEQENLPQIRSYMNEKGYDKVDILILTHSDKDHIGGASDIISEYKVTTVIESCFSSSSEYYINYHSVLNNLGISPMQLSENYCFESDGCKIEIIAPKKKKYASKQDNNSSLIVSMECGEKRLLFCGDAMELRLAELIEESPEKYDFVKLPYHGNYLENYAEFLDAVKPDYGAITCSGKNPASEDTLALLDEYGVTVYQTRYGSINVTSDGKNINIKQE